MRSEVNNHLDVPTQQLKLGRSKSLNTSRSSSYNAMSIRPKRTYSLPNRDKITLPVVQIQERDNHGKVELENQNYSDRENERGYHWAGLDECQNQNDECEPLIGLFLSLVFLVWSRVLDLLQ